MLRRQMLRHEILMLKAYINPNPNPHLYPALNQKPNYTPQSNSRLRRGINAGAIVAGAYVVSPHYIC